MKENPSYYAILTADIRYNKDLSSSEKLFYAEITALSNKTGACWASRKYFADLYGVEKRTVTRWTNKLCKLGFIDVDYEYADSGEITKRAITIGNVNGLHIVQGVKQMSGGGDKNDRGGSDKNDRGGGDKNVRVNTTRSNSTSTNSSVEEEKNPVNHTRYVEAWNEINGANVRLTKKKIKDIERALDSYTEDELMNAMKIRAQSKMLKPAHRRDWNTFFGRKRLENVDKWVDRGHDFVADDKDKSSLDYHLKDGWITREDAELEVQDRGMEVDEVWFTIKTVNGTKIYKPNFDL